MEAPSRKHEPEISLIHEARCRQATCLSNPKLLKTDTYISISAVSDTYTPSKTHTMTSPYHTAAREKRAADRISDERNANLPDVLPIHSGLGETEDHGHHHGHHHRHHPPAPKSWFPVREEGESGRSGFHPWHFFRIVFRSSSLASRAVNVLWPVVPAAIAVRYAAPEQQLAIFILAYIAMVPW